MGRTILCNACKSTFDENVLANKENPNVCPVCGNSLINESKNTEFDFGDGIELSEDDSFDEDKIDFYYTRIIEPGELGEGERGLTFGTCAKCGTHTSFLCPVAKNGIYILLDSKETETCRNCGNELKNHILKKLPVDWVDPRKSAMWAKDYSNTPKCPICGAAKISKISMTNKVTSAIAFGVFAAGHISKTYKCDICGSKF